VASDTMGRMRHKFLAALLAVLTGFVAMPAAALATDGARVTGESSYDARPGDGVVHVRVDVSITNTTVDQVVGNQIRRLYFVRYGVPVASKATKLTASSGSTKLAVTVESVNYDLSIAYVAFSDLFAGQTRSIALVYDIVGAAPRGDDIARINAAYASFVAYAVGDPLHASVRVSVPANNATEIVGSTMTRTREGDALVYASNAIADPTRFASIVSTRNDAVLTTIPATVDGHDVVARGWPGDAEWDQFVRDGVRGGLPTLVRLVGLPWPITGQLQITEATTPYLRGYAGWFAPKTNTIEVGENLDDATLFHELSHAWFNDDLFSARWINEAFAEEYSARTLAALGRSAPSLTAPVLTDPAAHQLDNWSRPLTSDAGARASELYGYRSAAWLMHQLVDEIGVDRMAAVISAAANEVPAYDGTAREFGDLPGTSERFLDLLEEIGGSTRAAQLFRDYVFAPGDVRLDERATARAAYHALESASGDWDVPAVIRRAMSSWDHAAAQKAIEQAQQVLATRDQIAQQVALFSGTSSDTLRAAYASSFDLTDTAHRASVSLASAERVAAGAHDVARGRSVTERVGVLFGHPDREVTDARAAFAADDLAGADAHAAAAQREIADASAAGRLRLAIAGAVLLVCVVLAVLLRRWRRRVRAAASPVGLGDAPVVTCCVLAKEV
jgi:hypothetical protein